MAALVPSAAPWPIVVESIFSATWPTVLSSSPDMVEMEAKKKVVEWTFKYGVGDNLLKPHTGGEWRLGLRRVPQLICDYVKQYSR